MTSRRTGPSVKTLRVTLPGVRWSEGGGKIISSRKGGIDDTRAWFNSLIAYSDLVRTHSDILLCISGILYELIPRDDVEVEEEVEGCEAIVSFVIEGPITSMQTLQRRSLTARRLKLQDVRGRLTPPVEALQLTHITYCKEMKWHWKKRTKSGMRQSYYP